MSIFSRRTRLLNRTPKAPKMSSRRQFHRALRRHPAWPVVMEQAAARAKAHKEQEAARVKLQKEEAAARARARKASSRARFRRRLQRNRVLLVTLLAAGGLVVVLTGLAGATGGYWSNHHSGSDGDPPPNRFGMASAYDRINKEILMFGGFGVGPPVAAGIPVPSAVALDETWGQDVNKRGNQWSNRNPIHKPSPRGYASMAFDAARNNMVLFGGAPYRSNAVSNETWTWDGVDWTLREPPGDRPPARQNASMVYDAHRRNVVLFGGRGANGNALNDTWTWDGSAWEKQDVPGPPAGPGARHSAAMAYDICRGEAVMFGGSGDPPNSQAQTGRETWTWNGTIWINRTPFVNGITTTTDPSNVPTPRYGASMTYSYRTGRVLLYGGFPLPHYTAPLFAGREIPLAIDNNMWSWDGTQWRKEDATTNLFPYAAQALYDNYDHHLPSPRAYALFEYGRVNTRSPTSLFGGTRADPNPAPQLFNTDHYRFTEYSLGAEADSQASPVFGTIGCVDPVPLPAEETSTGDQDGYARKTALREEIKEIARLPVLLGTDPKTVPAGSPKPDCLQRDGSQSQGRDGSGNTHLVTDPQRNRVYQFYLCAPPSSEERTQGRKDYVLIEAYDGATLKPLGSGLLPLPSLANYGGFSVNSSNVWLDAGRGRFVLTFSIFTSGAWVDNVYFVYQDLIEKKIGSFYEKITLPPEARQGKPVEGFLVSFFSHPKTGLPKLLISLGGANPAGFITSGSNPSSTPAKVAQWDLESNSKDWEVAITACVPAALPSKGYRSQDGVYTSCLSGNNDNGQHAVVRIPITESTGTETTGAPETYPGPNNVRRTWFDPQACRMLLQSSTFIPDGSSLWVWDCESSRYVGRVGLAQTTNASSWGAGFDQQTGRFYMLAPNHKAYNQSIDQASNVVQGGLLVVDTRLTPVPAAENFAQFSSNSSAQMGILPSAAGLSRRIFMRRDGGEMQKYPDGGTVNLPQEMHYKVLADELAIPKQPSFDQQDALTIPVTPNDKTEVSFDAEASAYGVRLRRIGGILTFSASTDPPCLHPDRVLIAGWVADAHLSDIEATARTLGLEADSATKQDLQGPGSRCLIPQNALNAAGSGAVKDAYEDTLYPILRETLPQVEGPTTGSQLEWSKSFDEAECSGNSSTTTQTAGASIYGSATCKQTQAVVTGTARGAVAAQGSGDASFSVGEGSSNVVVAREAVRGVVVTSTAEAKAIKIGPISIGYVKTVATSWSNGRPFDGARASFTRIICQGSAPNQSSCYTTPQEQKTFVDQFNTQMRGRATMTLPLAESALLRGTPGGYAAGVTKPIAQEAEEKLFEPDNQKEVIGLRITIPDNNNPNGAVTHHLDLAGVRAVTGFGVQCGSEYVYSPAAKSCVPLPEDVFPEDPPVVEEEATLEDSEDGPELYAAGEWEPQATNAPQGLALGRRIGRFLENLPIIRQLPIRAMGEALLAWSVWFLLALPLLFAWRRLSLNLGSRP